MSGRTLEPASRGECATACLASPEGAVPGPRLDAPVRRVECPAPPASPGAPALPSPPPPLPVTFGIPGPAWSAAAEDLAEAIGLQLGLQRSTYGLRFDQEAARRTEALGAAGLAGERTVWLHPRRFDPATFRGRYLLGHELAHLAQRPALRTRPGGLRLGRAAAELEAHTLGMAAASRGLARLPALLLPPGPAADAGFAETVHLRYRTEIARIKQLLRGLWGFLWVTDGMVEEICIILQSVDFPTARAMLSGDAGGAQEVERIGRNEREKLLGEFSNGHRQRFRKQVLAAYSVMEREILSHADAGIFGGMDFYNLSEEEHFALLHVREHMPPAEWDRLHEDERRHHALERLERPGSSTYDAEAAATQSHQRLRADMAASRDAELAVQGDARLGGVLDEVVSTLRRGPSERERLELLDKLEPWMREPLKLRRVAEVLQDDQEGDLFDRWLHDFPVTSIYQGEGTERSLGERRMAVLLRLVSHRDPWRNYLLARELATQTWFLDIVNDEEAWLAMQLLQALPDDMRARFLADHEDSLRDNLSRDMRESATANYYGGGEGGEDLASIQTQLLEPALWTVAGAGRLAGLARMAIAARQHRWLFDQSHIFHTTQREEYLREEFLERIVEPFQLYHPGATPPREEYRPEYLESVPWFDEGPFYYVNRFGVQAIDFLASSRDMHLLSRSIGGEGLNAVEFQDIFGGSFLGIRFTAFEDLGEEGARARETRSGVNFIDRAAWDQSQGVLEVEARNLAIAAVRYPIGDILFQAGGGRVRGLSARIAYPTDQTRRPTSMRLEMGSLELQDSMFVMPDSMLGINRIELEDLEVNLGNDAVRGEQDEARSGYDFWSVIFLPNFARLVGFEGIPLIGPLPHSARQLGEGLRTPETPTSLQVLIGSLRVEGITTSGGLYIDSLEAENLSIGMAGSREDYLEMLWQSQRELTRRKVDLSRDLGSTEDPGERAHIEARISRLDAQIESVRQLASSIITARNREEELTRRRGTGAGLTAAESEQLEADQALLARFDHGGAVVDSGRIAIRGLEGEAALEALELEDVHGAGTSAPSLLRMLSGSDALPRILGGADYRGQVVSGRDRGESDFELDLGDLELRGLRIAEGIPSVDEVEEELEAAWARREERPWDPEREAETVRITVRLAYVLEYRRLASIGVTYLESEERQRILELRRFLTSGEAFYAHHVSAQSAALTFGRDGRTVGLSAERLDAFRPRDADGNPLAGEAGIRMGELTIGEIHGRRVHGSIDLEGGLIGAGATGGLRGRLRGAGLEGEHLEAVDVRYRGEDITLERAVLDEFNLSADLRAGILSARAGRVAVEGLHTLMSEEELQREIGGLEAMPEERRSSSESARLLQLREALDTYRGFVELIERLRGEAESAADGPERAQAREMLATTLSLFSDFRRSLGVRSGEVRDLSARVSGLGPVLDPGFSVDRALERGITLEGTGESHRPSDASDPDSPRRHDRLFSSGSVTDARFGPATAQRIEAGEALGRVEYGRRRIAVQNVFLERFSATDFFLQAAGHQVWSHGTSSLNGLTLDAELRFEDSAAHPGDLRLAGADISRARIESLQANGLGYWNPDMRLSVEIESGILGGISATGLSVSLPEDGEMVLRGAAGIESLSDVRVQAMMENVFEYGQGRFNGSGLEVEFLESGGQRFRIGELSLEDGNIRTSAGEIRLAARRLSGEIVHEGDTWDFRGVELESLELHRFAWQAGARKFTARQPAVLEGIRVDASVDTAREGDTRIHLRSLHVDRLLAQHFRYEEPPLTVEFTRLSAFPGASPDEERFTRPPLEAVDIDVTGLDWSQRAGFSAGAVDVAAVHGALEVLREELDLGAVVDATDIHVGFRRDGQDWTIGQVGLEASGTLAEGVTVHVAAHEASPGTIRIFEDRVEIPDLVMPIVELHQLGFENEDYRLSIPDMGEAVLLGTHANLVIELNPEGTTPSVRRIVVRQLRIPEMNAWGVELTVKHLVSDEGGAHDLTLTLPDSITANITDITLGAADESGEGFVITPQVNAEGEMEWLREGVLGVGSVDAQGLGAELEGFLEATANLRVENLRVGMFSDGTNEIDIATLQFEEVHFFLRDLGAFTDDSGEAESGQGAAAAPEVPILKNLRFLDALDGTVSFDLNVEWIPDIADIDMTIHIHEGVISLTEIEDETGAYDGVLDFDVEGNNLVLNFDWGNLLAIVPAFVPGTIPAIIPAIIPQANYPVLRWENLEDDDPALAEEDQELALAEAGQARISTLVEPSGRGSGSGGDMSSLFHLETIEADLRMLETRIDLGSHGNIILGGGGHDAVEAIRVRGDLPSRLTFDFDHLRASTDPDRPLRFGGREISVESLYISTLRDGSLEFSGFTPRALSGDATLVDFRNIHVGRETP